MPMRAYLARTAPNPAAERVPWYNYTAPCYAGVFLWVGFYELLAQGTIDRASFGVVLLAVVTAGLLGYALFYHVPAMLGMRTGYPLGVLGSSIFGSKGGQLMPGLLTAVFQVGWFGVATFFATRLILTGLGANAEPRSLLFAVVAVPLGYALAYAGMTGIRFVARIAVVLNVIPLVAILILFFIARHGLEFRDLEEPESLSAFVALVQMVTAFAACACAAAPEFGMHSRDAKDVLAGGLLGVTLPIVCVGSLGVFSVAGAHALDPGIQGFSYITAAVSISGSLSTVMVLGLAIGCIPAACFFAFIASSNLRVMLPQVRQLHSTMLGATAGIVFAITGLAGHLAAFIPIAGAAFAPICGAMAADYIQAGMRWPRTRPGINYAGFGSWVLGFLVGILPLLPVSEQLKVAAQPAAVYSFLIGFIGYIVLANVGLKPYRKHKRKRM